MVLPLTSGCQMSPKLGMPPSGDHLSVRQAMASVPQMCGSQCTPMPSKFHSTSPILSMAGFTVEVSTRVMSKGCTSSSGYHCNARTLVGLMMSKPRPLAAFILSMISSLEPMPV